MRALVIKYSEGRPDIALGCRLQVSIKGVKYRRILCQLCKLIALSHITFDQEARDYRTVIGRLRKSGGQKIDIISLHLNKFS